MCGSLKCPAWDPTGEGNPSWSCRKKSCHVFLPRLTARAGELRNQGTVVALADGRLLCTLLALWNDDTVIEHDYLCEHASMRSLSLSLSFSLCAVLSVFLSFCPLAHGTGTFLSTFLRLVLSLPVSPCSPVRSRMYVEQAQQPTFLRFLAHLVFCLRVDEDKRNGPWWDVK